MMDLQHYMQPKAHGDPQAKNTLAIPLTDAVPEYWLLTSSGGSGMIAAHFGMAAAFAQFINPGGGPEVVRMYRERFQPSASLHEPHATVAVMVLCADTPEKVAELRFTAQYQLLQMEKGIFEGYPDFESIRHYEFTEYEKQRIRYNSNRMVAGTPEQVKAQLTELAGEYGVDEIIAVTITYDFRDRLRSYELLAQTFELSGN